MATSSTRPLKRQRSAFCATRGEKHVPGIVHATLIGATATAASQLVGTPIDVLSKCCNGNALRFRAVGELLRRAGPAALFRGLPMHLLKRTPTKALTVCLFETLRGGRRTLTRVEHMRTAMVSGTIAMMATYPAHVFYYAFRKGISASAVLGRARVAPAAVLYAGLIPSLLAVIPAVIVDYSIYNAMRAHLSAPQRPVLSTSSTRNTQTAAVLPPPTPSTPTLAPLAAMVAAAALSNMTAGAFSEPLKMVARRTAVAAVKGRATTAPVAIARELLAKGPAEFWRGFPRRSVRYAMTAVVSKAAVLRLRRAESARVLRRQQSVLATQ